MKAIDLFAGFGGFTLGAEMAGCDVVWAANHWPLAVDTHAANHPHTHHECQDLRQADWTKLPAYDLLLAGPSCPGNSSAGQPGRARSASVRARHDAIRADPWAVVSCAEATQPKAVIVENVRGIRRWKLFPHWLAALETLGYHVQHHVLRASRFGVPQRRDRCFVVATRDPFDLLAALDPSDDEPAFGPCVDWGAGEWTPIGKCQGREAKQRLRMASRAHGRCVAQHVSLSTKAKAATGLPLSEPLRTITTKDQWVVVDGDRFRYFSLREYARGQGIPDGYALPSASRADVIRGIGNAVPPRLGEALVSAVMEAA